MANATLTVGRGKQINNGLNLPYNFSVKRQPASEISFALTGQVSLAQGGSHSGQHVASPCKLEGRGVTFDEDIQCNPFADSFYSHFYPDATGCDLFYKLTHTCEKENGFKHQKVLYLSSELRFTLCTIQEAINAAINVIQQSSMANGTGANGQNNGATAPVTTTFSNNAGDYFSVGKANVLTTSSNINTVQLQNDHLGLRAHCFVLLTVNTMYKVLLYVYKYAEGPHDFLLELKYVESTEGIEDVGLESAHVYASLAFPISIYTKLVNLHPHFNMAEQAFYNHVNGRDVQQQLQHVAVAPVTAAGGPAPVPQCNTGLAPLATVTFEDVDQFNDFLEMQTQEELSFMQATAAAATKKRSRSKHSSTAAAAAPPAANAHHHRHLQPPPPASTYSKQKKM